uniref:hypothetical protein n=1 Tax=Bifidobacterium longum TaxID=216816 RepID=UPI00359C728F
MTSRNSSPATAEAGSITPANSNSTTPANTTAMVILNPVAGKLYDRIGGRPLALLGFAIMTFAAVLLSTTWVPIPRYGSRRCTSRC